jgi:hypothetical protein
MDRLLKCRWPGVFVCKRFADDQDRVGPTVRVIPAPSSSHPSRCGIPQQPGCEAFIIHDGKTGRFCANDSTYKPFDESPRRDGNEFFAFNVARSKSVFPPG